MEDRPDTPSSSLQSLPLPGDPPSPPGGPGPLPSPTKPCILRGLVPGLPGAGPRAVTSPAAVGGRRLEEGVTGRLSTSESSLPGLVCSRIAAGGGSLGPGMAVRRARGPGGQGAQP